MTMFAAVSSGLSLFAISSETNSLMLEESDASRVSISISEFEVSTGSKAVDLTVMTLISSSDLTVAIQLPA